MAQNFPWLHLPGLFLRRCCGCAEQVTGVSNCSSAEEGKQESPVCMDTNKKDRIILNVFFPGTCKTEP